MSKDNLILFPNKRKPNLGMTNAEAKWMVSGSLLVVLCVALGVNSSLFSKGAGVAALDGESGLRSSRSIASVNPIFRVSWEKKTFEVLENTKERELANVGKAPSPYDDFKFGDLEGKYDVRKVNGLVAEIQLSQQGDVKPKAMPQTEDFLKNNLALFSSKAQQVKQVHVENNDEQTIQRYSLIDAQGQSLGLVQVLLDGQKNLLSMTVQ